MGEKIIDKVKQKKTDKKKPKNKEGQVPNDNHHGPNYDEPPQYDNNQYGY